jgi:hypothetical protein
MWRSSSNATPAAASTSLALPRMKPDICAASN